MDVTSFLALATACAPLVDSAIAHAIVAVESSHNAYAIGVVGGALDHQPRDRAQAVATAKALQQSGWNFSVGLAQINVRNFARLGLNLQTAFEPCANLAAMQAVLTECFDRANQQSPAPQRSLRQALSCYYSGNFATGFEHGYVQRVVRAAASTKSTKPRPSNQSRSAAPSPSKEFL